MGVAQPAAATPRHKEAAAAARLALAELFARDAEIQRAEDAFRRARRAARSRCWGASAARRRLMLRATLQLAAAAAGEGEGEGGGVRAMHRLRLQAAGGFRIGASP